MNRRRKQQKTAIFTRLGFNLALIAFFGLVFIAIRRRNDSLGTSALIHSMLLLSGLVGTSLLTDKTLIPINFKPMDLDTTFRALIIAALSMLIQLISALVLTIADIEHAFFYIFAAVSEELFFRAFILTLFKRLQTPNILNIFISAACFTAIHVNYYGNITKIVGVFFGGIMLAIVFVIWEDITANILGHMINNLIAVGNRFLRVSLASEPTILILMTIIFIIINLYGIEKLLKEKDRVERKKYFILIIFSSICLLITLLSFIIDIPIFAYGGIL